MRLSDGLITNERYRGEPTTDDEGRTQWPLCVLWDDEIQGFGIRIFPPLRGKPSRKDFIVTWKLGLKSRTMAIGTYGVDCTLRQARRTAREALDLARRGQDPIEARQRALGIGTAEDLASRFLFEHTAAKKKPAAPPPDAAAEVTADDTPAADAPDAQAVPEAAALEDTPSPGSSPEGAAPAAAPTAESPTVEPPPTAEPTLEAASAPAPASNPTPAATTETLTARSAPAEEGSSSAEPEPAEPAEPEPEAEPSTVATRAAAPLAAGAPKIDEAHRRTAAPPPPAPKRGPTKVRLLPVPDSLYRTIEHGARESGMTVAAYLGALIEIARAAVGEDAGGGTAADGSISAPGESGPSIKELFARVQEAQAAEVGQPSAGGDSEQGESSD